jgi:hypothetical protein
MCEKCNQREATSAAQLSFGHQNVTLTHLCQPCLEAEHAKRPASLLGLLDEMEGKSQAPQQVLVFELSRDGPRQADNAALEKMWEAYQQGGWSMQVAEGRISKVISSAPDAEPIFEIDDGRSRTSWSLQGDRTAYSVGRKARVESIVFGASGASDNGRAVVTRIWIENET